MFLFHRKLSTFGITRAVARLRIVIIVVLMPLPNIGMKMCAFVLIALGK